MAKKKYIISESAVRRFQKLATISPITEMYGMSHDKPMEEEAEMYEEEEPPMDEPPMDEPPMDEPPMDEPPMDAEGPAPGGDAEEMARNVIMAVADALGVDIDIDGGEEEAAEMDMEPEMEPEEEVMEEDTLEEMDHAEDTLEEVEVIDEDALTEAVMKRVLGRLKEMTSKSKK